MRSLSVLFVVVGFAAGCGEASHSGYAEQSLNTSEAMAREAPPGSVIPQGDGSVLIMPVGSAIPTKVHPASEWALPCYAMEEEKIWCTEDVYNIQNAIFGRFRDPDDGEILEIPDFNGHIILGSGTFEFGDSWHHYFLCKPCDPDDPDDSDCDANCDAECGHWDDWGEWDGSLSQVVVYGGITITGQEPTDLVYDSRIPRVVTDGLWPTVIRGGDDAISVEGSHVDISNIHFYEFSGPLEWGAIWVYGSSEVNISHCKFERPLHPWTYAVGLWDTTDGTITANNNVFLTSVEPDDAEEFAIMSGHANSHLEVSENYFDATGDCLSRFYSNLDGTLRDLLVSRNVMYVTLGHGKSGAVMSAESFENRYIEDNVIVIKETVNHGRGEAHYGVITLSNPAGFDNLSASGRISNNLIDLSRPTGSVGAISLWSIQIYTGEGTFMPTQVPVHNLEISGNTIIGAGEVGIAIPEPRLPGEDPYGPNAASNIRVINNDLSDFTVRRLNPGFDMYCETNSCNTDVSDPLMMTEPAPLQDADPGAHPPVPFKPDTGDGLIFDGRRYVQFPDGLFTNEVGEPFSFAVWFKTTGGGVIFGQTGVPYPVRDVESWAPLVYVGADGYLYVGLQWSPWTGTQLVSGDVVSDDRFHHIVMTYDGSTLRAYLDGEMLGSVPAEDYNVLKAYHYLGTGQSLWYPAASDYVSIWYSFQGLLDEVHVFPYAIGEAQVSDLLAATGPVGGESAYYSCNTVTPGPLETLPDDSPGIDHPALVSPHFCASQPPKYVDGFGHIWISEAAVDNFVSGNLLGPVEAGVAGIVCDGETNEIDAARSSSFVGDNLVHLRSTSRENTVYVCPDDVAVLDEGLENVIVRLPELTFELSSDHAWPPNHEYSQVRLHVCGDAQTLAVASNEPDNAVGGGDGNTIADIVILDADGMPKATSADCGTDSAVASAPYQTGDFVELRSEFLGSAEGRVYTLTLLFADEDGNETSVSRQFSVFHDQRAHRAHCTDPDCSY